MDIIDNKLNNQFITLEMHTIVNNNVYSKLFSNLRLDIYLQTQQNFKLTFDQQLKIHYETNK